MRFCNKDSYFFLFKYIIIIIIILYLLRKTYIITGNPVVYIMALNGVKNPNWWEGNQLVIYIGNKGLRDNELTNKQ